MPRKKLGLNLLSQMSPSRWVNSSSSQDKCRSIDYICMSTIVPGSAQLVWSLSPSIFLYFIAFVRSGQYPNLLIYQDLVMLYPPCLRSRQGTTSFSLIVSSILGPNFPLMNLSGMWLGRCKWLGRCNICFVHTLIFLLALYNFVLVALPSLS